MARRGMKREPSAATSTATQASPPQDANTNIPNPQSNNQDDTNAIINPNGSLKTLGRGVKELVQAVQNLRNIGVEELDLPLPKIVVVGDQSTGKSSLIEAMSEIKVPRGAGTCTRCPLEINLTESTTSAWSCDIYLCTKYAYDGKQGIQSHSRGFRKSEGATRDRPLGPWILQHSEELHFASLDSKAEVPRVLHLAQLAILNPTTDHNKYLPDKDPGPRESFQVKFSPNVIRLNISGPGLPNLSFYDLPGVINVPDVAEEHYVVDLIKNLVKQYVQAKDSINLLAIPMTDDPANSSASKLIRELKAEPRTIGCLTKPDRLQSVESLEQWEGILKGERFHLGFGYFVIKNNPDTSVDHATVRAEEEAYFQTSMPWASTFEGYVDQFGTFNLQTRLSELLTKQIQLSLPRLSTQVQEKIFTLETRLRQLPEPLQGHLPAIILGEMIEFKQALHLHFDGGRKEQPFLKSWRDHNKSFRLCLANTKPILEMQEKQTFPVRKQETPTPGSWGTEPISIDSEDDILTPSQSTGSKRSHPANDQSPSKASRGTNSSPKKYEMSNKTQSKSFNFGEVESFIQNAYTGGIPSSIHPSAVEEMIQQSIKHWDGPLKSYLTGTEAMCERMIADRLEETFGHRRGTRFYDEVFNFCGEFLKDQFAQQRVISHRILDWERETPQTLNEEAFLVAREEAADLLKDHRRKSRVNKAIDKQESQTSRPLTTGTARAEKIAKYQDSQLEAETRGLELEAMSIVKAYYKIAFNRFVDNICQCLRFELFKNCRNGLYMALSTKFDVHHPDANQRLAVLLAANPRDEELRVMLKKEKETLERAQQCLEDLQT